MSERRETLCFECGQIVGTPPILNRHESGETCRRCADRVLESLPPALPQPVPLAELDEEHDDYEFDLPGADFRPDDPPEPA